MVNSIAKKEKGYGIRHEAEERPGNVVGEKMIR